MKPLFQQGPSLTARLVILAVASAVLMTVDHRQDLLEPVRYTLSAALYPVRVLANLPSETSDFMVDRFKTRRELREENARLRAQHLLYEARLQKLDALEVENIRLRELLDSAYEVGESVLIAELMRVDLDPYTHLLQIDKGGEAGVYRGQPVLDAHGVMGQVDKVGPFSAMVRLITDPSHAIPVQVNRNGIRSVAIGTGNLNLLELSSLPNNSDIRAGDLLVTSGLGGRFPKGYPVARVKKVEIDPGQPFAEVTATPLANLNRSQQVLLVRRDETPRQAAADAPPGEPSAEAAE
ncbi:rod shape-determining protein MreC [Ectothiorhodospiraceae bacterium WFHF3C12]|nr:rod shape-determining protein MreC [Ectothiorhodospiraceae bacterium WFHF3C12]